MSEKVGTYLVQYNGAVPVLDVRNELVFVQELHGGAVGIVGEWQVVLREVKTVVLEVLRLFQHLMAVGVWCNFAGE